MTVFIKGGKIVNSDTSFVADIILQDGKIAKVGPNLDIPGKYSSVAQEKCVTPILRHKLLINATESSTLTFNLMTGEDCRN